MNCDCTTTLCTTHQQSFVDILGDIPDRLSTMRVSITKQAVMGGQGGKPTNDDDRPLPVNLGAAEANHQLRAELVNFLVRVRHCLSESPHDRTMHGATAWAIKLMPRISVHPESVSWYEAISRAYEKTTRAIDLPPERIRAGTCPGCSATLYVYEGHETAKCKPCDTSHPVEDLQQAELDKIRGYTGTAAEVLRALHRAEVKIRMTRLTKWADRGQIIYTTGERGRLFTVGDVLDTYTKMEQPA